MQTLAQLARQYAHDDWANRETLASLLGLGAPPAKAVEVFGHILGAEELWLARLTDPGSKPEVWPRVTPDACGRRLDELNAAWSRFLSSLDEPALEREVRYVNSLGERWTSRVIDILLHVPLHAAHHRGQIAAELVRHGFTPAYTDYIHGVRNGWV